MRLILSLKPREVQFVQDYYSLQSNGGNNRKLELFNLIKLGGISDNQKASRVLYRSKPNSAFCHLKKRLEQDILDFMLVGPAVDKATDEISEEINCRKTLLQGEILISRGIYDAGISLLKKSTRLAEKYEFPDLKLAAFDILRKYDRIKTGFTNSNYYSDQMDNALVMLSKILKAKEIRYRVRSNIDTSEPTLKSLSEDSLESLTHQYRPGDSKRAHFWYETALIEYYFQQKNFPAARNFTVHLLKFLEQEPALESCSRKAELYLKFAEILIHLREYDKAVTPASKSVSLFPADSLDSVNALKVLFFAYYRSQDFLHAEEIYNRAIRHQHMNPTLIYRWNMFKAALKFSEAKYGLVRQTLHSTCNLNQNQSLWILGFKFLELLNILELKDYDWFEFRLDTFGKKLSKLKSHSCLRFNIIYCLLKTLMKTNFSYCKTIDCESDNLCRLNKNKTSMYWDPMGSELINFSSWLNIKTRR